MQRRECLATVVGATSLSIAGCLASGDGNEQNSASEDTTPQNDGEDENEENEDNRSDSTTETVSVRPEIIDVSYPEPRRVSLDDHEGTEKYLIEIQNVGEAGDIEYTLVWLEDQSQDPWGPHSESEVTHKRFFDEDERRELSVIAEMPDKYNAFGFRLQPGEVLVEVRNNGGEGRVEVLMKEGNQTVDDRKLLMVPEERETVSFETGDHLNWDELDFEVREI